MARPRSSGSLVPRWRGLAVQQEREGSCNPVDAGRVGSEQQAWGWRNWTVTLSWCHVGNATFKAGWPNHG